MALEFVRLVSTSWDCTLNPAGIIIINTAAEMPACAPCSRCRDAFQSTRHSSIYLSSTSQPWCLLVFASVHVVRRTFDQDGGPPGCFVSPTPGRATPSSAYAGGGCSPPASPWEASPGPAVSV